jgi:hypothetical protein
MARLDCRGLLVSLCLFGAGEGKLIVAATNAKGETENYWGVDHMGQLCDHLGLERPSGKGWKALL